MAFTNPNKELQDVIMHENSACNVDSSCENLLSNSDNTSDMDSMNQDSEMDLSVDSERITNSNCPCCKRPYIVKSSQNVQTSSTLLLDINGSNGNHNWKDCNNDVLRFRRHWHVLYREPIRPDGCADETQSLQSKSFNEIEKFKLKRLSSGDDIFKLCGNYR